ncbi:MAG: hypothetical protein ACXQS2_01260, partial [Methermicoccaceae archaeon]
FDSRLVLSNLEVHGNTGVILKMVIAGEPPLALGVIEISGRISLPFSLHPENRWTSTTGGQME